MKKICMIGAFDTKGPEYAFVRECILARGHEVLTVNTAVLGSTDLFAVDVEAEKVAEAGGASLEQLREDKDRGRAMKVMCAGAPVIVKSLHDEGKIDGIIGMGGTGGTTVVTAAMRALPVGVPKVCVSTAASGDVSAYVGTKDITMIPSIVDVAGINRISRIIFSRAAGAVCGMAEAGADVVVAHMGLTTKGAIGASTALTLEQAPARVQQICETAKSVNPDVIVLCHGGPISMPDDAEFVLRKTIGVDGFYGASSVERLPSEMAITEQMKKFKSIRFE